MKNIFTYFFYFAVLLLVLACSDEPDFPIVPKIEFKAMQKNVLNQNGGFNGDSSLVTITFQDGDGDIGGDTIAIFRRDLRQPDQVFEVNRLPLVPLEGVSSSISGEIDFYVLEPCCIYDNGQPSCQPSTLVNEQEVVQEIYITDRAGNQSNVITLPPITIICN